MAVSWGAGHPAWAVHLVTESGEIDGLGPPRPWTPRKGAGWLRPVTKPGNVGCMSACSRKIAKPAAGIGVLVTMASIWWFALRPRHRAKVDE